MDKAYEWLGDVLVAAAVLAGVVSIAGLAVLQVYTFLADGVWHWFTLADLASKMGYEPFSILDPHEQWEWVGVGKIVNWTFYTAPAAAVAIVVCFLVLMVGVGMMMEV